MMKEWLGAALFAVYVFVMLTTVTSATVMEISRRRRIREMSASILRKLEVGIMLSSRDAISMGRGLALSAKSCRTAVSRLLVVVDEPATFVTLTQLVGEMEKEDPIDELPVEVRPSLVRLTALVAASPEVFDQHILTPVTATLSKYVELKAEQEKVRKQTRQSYVMTVLGIVLGAVGLYFTLRSPSEADLQRIVEQAIGRSKASAPSPASWPALSSPSTTNVTKAPR